MAGQVVIPKDLRDELGIEPGDEVSFWRDGDHVAVRPTRQRPHPMAFADAFGAALAVAERATLWTGDPVLLVADAAWQWRDLRDTG